MTFRTISALTALAGFAAALAMPGPADAQTRTRVKQPPRYIYYGTPERRVVRTPSGRRILVQQRSFLSAGTDSLTYDQHYADYALPPNYRPFIDYTDPKVSYNRMPLPDPWDIPGWPKY